MTKAAALASGPNLWELFEDPAFQALLKRFSQKCISWEEFLSLNLPLGMSPLGMWDLLNRLSRYMGIEFSIPDLYDSTYWFRRTHELTDLVSMVTPACGPDSRLYRIMTATGGQHFLMNLRISETIAATRLDGIAISDEDANILLRLDRAPRNATERLVSNTFVAMDHLPALLSEPFSRELFLHFRDLLLDGVEEESLAKTSAALGTGLFEWPDEMIERFADRQLEHFAAYANHTAGDNYDHGVLRALILADSFRFYRPLKNVSYQVGRLASQLYALKHNLPVLGLLPASRVKLDWDEGRILPPAVSFDRPTFESLRRRSPGDLTCLQTLAAQLLLVALRVVEHFVDAWEKRDQELRQMLKKDPELNDRQRSILGRALRKPEAEFTIRYHKNNHAIAYPTARRDFLELVDKGYLTLEQRGKAFIFVPKPELPGLFTDEQTLARFREFVVDKSFMEKFIVLNR